MTEYADESIKISVYSELQNVADKPKTRYVREPFEGSLVRDAGVMGNVSQEDCLKISLARTRQKIGDYARSCSWQWWCTLTFSPDQVDRTDFKQCMKKVRSWLNNQRKHYASNLFYLVVPEMHTKNQKKYGICWHAHALMADVGNMSMEFSGHYDNAGRPIYNLSGWRFGFSTAVKIEEGETYRVSRYILKYLNKQSHLLSKGSHRYYASRNLPKPLVTKLIVPPGDIDDLIEKIIDSTGKNVVYVSESQGYVDVKYIELLP